VTGSTKGRTTHCPWAPCRDSSRGSRLRVLPLHRNVSRRAYPRPRYVSLSLCSAYTPYIILYSPAYVAMSAICLTSSPPLPSPALSLPSATLHSPLSTPALQSTVHNPQPAMIVKAESPPADATRPFHLSFLDQNAVRVYTQTLSIFPVSLLHLHFPPLPSPPLPNTTTTNMLTTRHSPVPRPKQRRVGHPRPPSRPPSYNSHLSIPCRHP
jgi:hypothetical protein